MRAAIYLRVSTDEQTTDNQERALREVAARSGHEILAVYRDEGISGSKGRDKRPGFDLAGDWSGGVEKSAARLRTPGASTPALSPRPLPARPQRT